MKIKEITNKIIAVGVTMAVVAFGGVFIKTDNVLAYNAGIEAFVNSLYSDCLGRSADPTGFNDWCNKLATGQITGKQAAYGFFFSPEFQAKANSWSDTELINAYYKVFLNRGSDPSGASYWAQQIAGTTNDISILFTGFADSTEFASKCASYGVTVGPHINVPTTVRGSAGSGGSSAGGGSGLAAQTNGRRASSPEELDAYWTSRGYEVFYIDLGNGNTQKCYARFYDMTAHNNMVNAWRNQNGLPSLTVITDPNDPRVQFARIRAVEVAYSFSHKPPVEWSYAPGTAVVPRETAIGISGGENIYGGLVDSAFSAFQHSPMHNRSMLASDIASISTASCEVNFVQPDGVSIYVTAENWLATPTELPGYSGGLPAGYTTSSVQEFWE